MKKKEVKNHKKYNEKKCVNSYSCVRVRVYVVFEFMAENVNKFDEKWKEN